MAIAVVTGVLSALVTTQLVLVTTQVNMERRLVQEESQDAERTAALLGTKVEMLRNALRASARQAPASAWAKPEAMHQHLLNNAGLSSLFESIFAAEPDGTMLARIVKTKASSVLANVADRSYFQRALKTDQVIVSEPLSSKLVNTAVVVLAISAQPAQPSRGNVLGIYAGILELGSNNLFAEVNRPLETDGARVLVMNRAGVVLAHPDHGRLLGQAADEPGLGQAFKEWRAVGSPIDTAGVTKLSEDHLVAMAGIPDTEWTLVRLTPAAQAFQPIDAAHQTAWQAAAGVGILIALMSGLLAWLLTRPISSLQNRVRRMLAEGDVGADTWPQDASEIGQLASAFQRVVQQRDQRQRETHALLDQLEAIMDYAQVGIAFTRNGHFELVSGKFCAVFGFDKAAVLGKPTWLLHPSTDEYAKFSERAHPDFMDHGTYEGEVRLVRADGALFWAQMRGRAVVPGDRSQGTIWTVEDITAARAQREELTWSSSHDALTGLLNRLAFERSLAMAKEGAGTDTFCVMFVDLDRFKQVNDTAGHAAGDAMLCEVTKSLLGQVRTTDTVARLGGDEFAILLASCPLAQATDIAEKLRRAVFDCRLPWEGQVFRVGASIGLVMVDETHETVVDVLRVADEACYASKAHGRNQVFIYQRP